MSPAHDENSLQSIWKNQTVNPIHMTPEQLRKRAAKFQSRIRWRNGREYVAAGIVVVWLGISIAHFHSMLTSLGAAMLILWALYFAYGMYRYGSSRALPLAPGAENCLAFHRQQLERQRDLARAWPWALAPMAPGILLFTVGFHLEHMPTASWEKPIGVLGIMSFLCVAIAIYNKLTADRLQREIDSLESMNAAT